MAIKREKIDVIKYIPNLERGEDKPFTVTLKRLTTIEIARLEDALTTYNQESKDIKSSVAMFNINLCKSGIIGWENVLDENDVSVKLLFNSDDNLVTDNCIDDIRTYIDEIAGVVSTISKKPRFINEYVKEYDFTLETLAKAREAIKEE
jgi:hypothetical protein